jgi:hypothetical protein
LGCCSRRLGLEVGRLEWRWAAVGRDAGGVSGGRASAGQLGREPAVGAGLGQIEGGSLLGEARRGAGGWLGGSCDARESELGQGGAWRQAAVEELVG